MKATNQIIAQANGTQKRPSFELAIMSDSMQRMIQKSVPDAKTAARITGALIQIVNSSEKLQQCEPKTIISSALRGEGMGLILGHGYYVVPYGTVAQYQISYKGYVQLAMSTGFYADLDCVEVREGELKGINRRTCKPDVDFSVYGSLEEREAHPVIGYYAYFELKDGTFRSEYWSIDKLLRHADRYSPAFSLKTYQRMINGEMSASEVKQTKSGSPWYDVGGSQDTMFRKTVMRKLLSGGYAPLSNEVRSAIASDTEDNVPPEIPVFEADSSTGEVIEGTGVVVDASQEDAPKTDFKTPVAQDAEGAETTRKKREPRKAAANGVNAAANKSEAVEERDYTEGFFN